MRRGNRGYWGARAAPVSRGREDLHVPPLLYWEALFTRTSEAKCRGLLLSRHEPEQHPALHESPSGAGLLQTSLPGAPPSPSPSPSPPATAVVPIPAPHGRAGGTAPGRSHLETGTGNPVQRGGKCGCSLPKAARKSQTLLMLFLEGPQTVSKKRNDFASQMPTKSLSCHLLCSGLNTKFV